ncbi:nudix-type nucleoside diphosphatase (YffH/AdpP family) [Chitinivorax tropicus]|uniref:GDP-mannose pyrophosphatase n=1 Tax=Chitinivorax tropicus TaxID=714531 RepID=A0A840MJ26_9PROT|nr:GDP-mannose pyrophosphatase NudK [Chitinivorax tropicus]MBB5016777.1 nudix-type nucleoside diphosphatase (YffH/AdpP family) [Chitinivorax tropicus]
MTENRIRIDQEEVLSDNWYILRKYSYQYQRQDGATQQQVREVYDRGNGATILLYNLEQGTVILIRQFRLPTFLNGYHGFLIETCAGLLDEDDPETCIKRETEEETGFKVSHVRKVFDVFMSPGAVTERIHFFIGEYEHDSRSHVGGGLIEEGEEIEVLELEFDEALAMIDRGEIIDAKTIMLLQHLRLKNIL